MRLTDLTELCEWTQRRTYQPGQSVFLEGDRSQMVFQVTRGIVKLTRVSSQGRELIVGLAFPGDYLDVVAILDGDTHGVSASALLGNEVELVSVARDRALASAPLSRALEQVCLQELRQQRDWTVAMALERVETRALNALSMLARRLGQHQGQQVRLRFVLNRQEFAELIGTSTETAIRILSQFRRQGIIREEGGWMSLEEKACVPA